ncbi:hypothetical protein ILUMI_09995 [Ignelater luminosus]|uniref:Coiled-coil domain-containing protein 93 n=1 Tax=Ignelater luminosus TaxID=2038154 RepID=A0A8K0D434_IGNLU|nr:hypothetical protein ILUMI_09995 [Ignelater luminosus]
MATVNPDLHHKFRSVKRLTSKQSEDEVEVEVREDEEQSVKLQEIIDLLVAAGYFRARIKGLSPFDKIVGGMTWCIESCNIDVDVDLLFQENSTIGQKIALTEKIVAVLPKMKCPHRIEPHQIQGLDCVHIFPVIQWLVQRSMEFRQEMSSFVQSYAVSQFNKEFLLHEKQMDVQKQILENVNTVREVYRPRRYYRRKTAPPDDLQARVQITLLEYGLRGDALNATTKSNEQDSIDQNASEFDIQQLLNSMTVMKEDVMENLVLTDAERLELTKHYASLQSEMEDGGVKSQEEKKLWALEQQKQILDERCSRLEEELNAIENSIVENETAIKDIKIKEHEVEKALTKLVKDEKEHTEDLKEVEELVTLNDSLKAQELQFKDYCKQELVRLKKLIDDTRNAKAPVEATTETDKELQEETERLKALRLQLAKKNRIIATLQRKLDEIPSRAELAQYQRRFLELYNQVAAKHKETKQYYTLYNTLEDTRYYITRELSLLNSICDQYPEAISSSSNKEEFLQKLGDIVDCIKQSRLKVEQKLIEEKQKRDQLSHTLQGLVEQQRRYVAAVRQLSIEFRKHEALLAQQNKS